MFALKLVTFIVLVVTLNALYYAPQWWPLRAATEMPVFWVDRAIPFAEWWVLPYWSFYPLLVLGGLFLKSREELRRFSAGVIAQAVVACVVFFVWPTTVSRSCVPAAGWFYHIITAMDHPLNACPSLHASYSIYSAIVLDRVLRSVGAGAAPRVLVWLWVAVIFASTLALRQHVVLDLAAGSLLAIAAFLKWPV